MEAPPSAPDHRTPPAEGARGSDAVALAGGSSWVFLGALCEGALRFVITWYLSGALGPEKFGVYSYAVTIVTLVAMSSPLGANLGILYFGARWLQAKDRGRLKGYLLTGLGVVLVTGPTAALALAALGHSGLVWQDKPGVSQAVILIAPAVAILSLLLYLVFALRSAKDMKRSTIAMQITVPVTLLAGVMVATEAGLGLSGVIVAFIVANSLAVLVAGASAWKWFGVLMRNRSVRPVFEPRRLVGYSIPQVIPAVIYRLNLWMDIMMLLVLGTAEQVGIYRVAVSLVVMVVVPVSAVTTMFSPQVAQLYHAGALDRLDSLLKVATRWIVIVVSPFYLVLVLEHRLILEAFDPEYMASANIVLVLAAGQAVHGVCAPSNRLIPMSGRSVLDMVFAIAAVTLNITLNYLLIPRFGGLGAAMSGATTFAVWGVSRVIAAYSITGCQPFTVRTVTLLLGAVSAGAVSWVLSPDQVVLHMLCTGCAILGFGALVLTVGGTPQDRELLSRVGARFSGLLGRSR